jgi:hypothetical protein
VQLAEVFNGFLRGSQGAVAPASRFGSLWVVAVVAGLGVLLRRRRLSVELLIAGVVAWAFGRALAGWYGQHVPPSGSWSTAAVCRSCRSCAAGTGTSLEVVIPLAVTLGT